jgi:arylformamidase
MSSHSGTHIDAPAHFIPGGRCVDQYDVRRCILDAHVVAIRDREAVRPSEFADLKVRPGEALLFKTHNSVSGRCRKGVFVDTFVYLTAEAADLCIEKGISLVGLDYITVERQGDKAFTVHRKLLGGDVLILEGIDLGQVPVGSYTLFCLPLKIKGGEASPVRAVLVR